MRVLELEQKFKSEETLSQVLEELQDDFNRIDYWAGLLKANISDNGAVEAQKGLSELTGTFMTLKTALAIAETEKKNREIRFYSGLRIETENSGKKFISAVGEKESAMAVAEYRRVRNIIKAYMEACQVGISTLQSILKAIIEEMKLSGKQG
ncbi:hypothetical protein LCGC14_2202730 [marine sediment metagenome]|uniref:Uncharacterized protein n=1 Tax=marine sediment metagenome TaxID=412755 RepID=A0A0F9GBZ8_9ZZZZ